MKGKVEDHLFTIEWNGETKQKFPCNNRKLMLFTTFFYIMSGILVWIDGLLCLYLNKNPQLYSHYLCNNIGTPDWEVDMSWEIPILDRVNNQTVFQLVTNSTFFKENYNEGILVWQEIYNYIIYNHNLSHEKSDRFFMNGLTFGFFQILAGLFAFNIRRPHHNWKKDSECLSSVSIVANITIWFFITFGNDFDYFIFFPFHSLLHFMNLVLLVICFFIKAYLLTFIFNDYFSAIPMFKPVRKVQVKS